MWSQTGEGRGLDSMADETKPAIGMSVGATALVAVTAERAVTRRPVLTLYPDRSPQVGVPAENPDIGEPGLVITDFVDQVGASEPVLASDGSAHRGEQLLADGVRALAYGATEGRPLPAAVAVTHPAHWSTMAVNALRSALDRVPEWSPHPVSLTSDVTAALTALQANPGLPDDGVIAVCDFGGSGSSITLVDAARGYQPVGTTVRHTGFSGDLIDQALLDHVVADLTSEGALGGTLAIGSLARLRDQCRSAKEHLSANTVTELPVDVPGFHGGIWLTRAELDEAIRQPFDGFLAAVQKALDRNNIPAADLAAVVSIGGGASIPVITTGLSQYFGVVVVSSPRPQLASAIGAALGVARGPVVGTATAVTTPTVPITPTPPRPTPPAPTERAPIPPAVPPAPITADVKEPPAAATPADMVPRRSPVEYQPVPGNADRVRSPWYRRPGLVVAGVALAVLVAGIVAVIALRHVAGGGPATSTITSESAVPTSGAPISRVPPAPIPGEGPMFSATPILPPAPVTIPPVPESPEAPAAP